jgi:CRISPR/Cas system CSM-associated protein Csm4 (group 5 of RAMP superfamily)
VLYNLDFIKCFEYTGQYFLVTFDNVKKTPLTKKAHEKSLTSLEQSLMAGPNCQAGQGEDGEAANLG